MNQMEILELKSTISEMKMSVNLKTYQKNHPI